VREAVTLPLLLSRRQAAKVLGVSRSRTLTRLLRSGRIPLVEGKVPLRALERFASGDAPAPTPRRRYRPPAGSEAAAIRDLDL
jgi:hypothetical protein